MRRGIGLLALALLSLFVGLLPAAAQAAPAVNGIYDLSGSPRYLTEGPDGNIWLTLSGSTEDVARITPDGTVTEYDGAAFNNPIGIASDGTDLWVTQSAEVVKFSPADPTAGVATGIADLADPRAITLGPDGNLWAGSGENVLRIPPAAPATYDKFPVPGMSARGIAANEDGVWVADLPGGQVIGMTPAGVATPYDVGDGFGPQEVGASPETDQVAYGNTAPPQVVGRINPGGTAMPTPAENTDPFGVAFGADTAWWFAQFASDNLGRLTQSGSYTTLGGLPAASGPRQITAGPDNTLWVGLEQSNQVARVTGLEPPTPSGGPQTVIKKAPKKVKAGKRGGKAKFKFSSPAAGARFECALKKKGKRNKREKKLAKYSRCKSPKTYRKLRKGRYTFLVRATAGGKKDATPAKAKFRVKRK